MSWQIFDSPQHWPELLEASNDAPQLVFKHSTRCSISAMVLNRFESSTLFQNKLLTCWFLDLIAHRELSNLIAAQTNIQHESPQCIVISKGTVIYAESHGAIAANTIQLMLPNQ